MNTDKQTYEILVAANEKIYTLLRPDRSYAVLLDSQKQTIYYPFIAEGTHCFRGQEPPWLERAYVGVGALPDQIIAEGKSISFEIDFPKQLEDAHLVYHLGEPAATSWLGVPLLSGSRSIGALIIEKRGDPHAFGANGQKLLETIAQHVALALQNTWLHRRLVRRIQYMSVLNEIGQKISANVYRNESEILEAIFHEAGRLPMDTSTMYIAFYDAQQDLVTFPLVYKNNKRVLPALGEDWKPRNNEHRRTEWVIEHRTPRLIKTREEAESWYQQMDKDYKDEVFASWMGAPLLVGNDTLGMLAVRHTEAYQYDEDDLLVLQILASQSAVAIQNFRLFTEKNNAEKLAMMSDISAEFVHRMNNLAGTIPSRAEQLRETLDSRGQIDHKILRDLDAIDKDARMILEAARKIKDATSHPVTKALMRVDDAIESALDRALAAQVSEDNFTIEKRISPELPLMLADPYRFVDVLTNIIKNGLDAIAEKGSGKLSVSASMGKLKNQPAIEISVEDEGVGISDTNLTRIFDLFYTTKKGGTGFGLWRDRFVVRELGGEILVRSKEGLGSTFKVLVPVEQPAALLN